MNENNTRVSIQVETNDMVTQDTTHVAEVTQVRTDDLLAYDSLVTALSWLSLEPNPDPSSDPHHDSTPLTLISILSDHLIEP